MSWAQLTLARFLDQSLSCLLAMVWGDSKTHQQVEQWQLAANFDTRGQQTAFSVAAKCEHSSSTPEQSHCNDCVQLLTLADVSEKTQSAGYKYRT